MKYNALKIFGLATALVWLFQIPAIASSGHGEEEGDKFNPTEMIMHHISDSHEFHLWGEGDESVSVPLPIILYTDNNGLDVFMSSEFHHGQSPVTRGENTYIMNHDKIYLANAEGALDFDEDHHATNAQPMDFSITKNVFSMLLSVLILILLFIPVAGKYKKGRMVPKGVQSFMEPLVLFVRDEIALPNIGKSKYERFTPFLLTIFFFIWINNMLGLIPIFPGSANLTGNIAFTMVMAAITMLVTNFSGNKHYWGHIFNTPGVPWWLAPIMVPVELIGVIAKPFALMVRLFANITAGHIIILSLISLIFVFKSLGVAPVSVAFVLFMNVLELLVAFLQAFIFTLLSALFIGSAVAEEHH